MSECKTHINNLEYILSEVTRKNRSFDDMDITLRLHLVIKYLETKKPHLDLLEGRYLWNQNT